MFSRKWEFIFLQAEAQAKFVLCSTSFSLSFYYFPHRIPNSINHLYLNFQLHLSSYFLYFLILFFLLLLPEFLCQILNIVLVVFFFLFILIFILHIYLHPYNSSIPLQIRISIAPPYITSLYFRVDKKRDKLERKVLDSQERAFWDVHRPAVSIYSPTLHLTDSSLVYVPAVH